MMESERLIARRFSEEDWRDLYEYLSLPETYRFEPGAPLDEEAAKALAAERARGEAFYAVQLKDGGKMIGHVYLGAEGPPEYRTYELGYIFNPAYGRRGYCTEASALVLGRAFGELGAHRVVAYCDPGNPASWRVLEKLGMRLEGVFRKKAFFRMGPDGEPLWHDCRAYAILAEERAMAKRILVGYVTKMGSTKETAEAIAKELSSRGFSAEARALAEAGDLGRYDGVVVGAPVIGMAWHPDALAFVRDHAAALSAKPVAYFLLSIAYGIGRESMKSAIPARLDPAKAIAAPVATACFGGVMKTDPPLPLRLAFGIKKGAPRDSRNWDEVKAFAAAIAQKMA
jgi:[ribosomal protein S5]-alanine N-acetyltransferase